MSPLGCGAAHYNEAYFGGISFLVASHCAAGHDDGNTKRGTRIAKLKSRQNAKIIKGCRRHGRSRTLCNHTLWKEKAMNWDIIQGKWKELKGQAKEKWGKLTDDDLDRIEGKRDQLVGRVQQKYGVAKDEAERQVEQFETACHCD
jgi:uncharacterized protein YjbJ (UPF0337 family)